MKQGYVKFENKNWGYSGDKGTWAKIDGNELIVCKAAKGTISSAYSDEIAEYCAKFDIDFLSMRCGEKKTVTIKID